MLSDSTNSFFQTQILDSERIDEAYASNLGRVLLATTLNLDSAKEECSRIVGGRLSNRFRQVTERGMISSFDDVRQLQGVVEQIGYPLLAQMIVQQDRHLIEAVSRQWPVDADGKSVLVGFSTVVDESITLTETQLVKLIHRVTEDETGMTEEEVKNIADRRAIPGRNRDGGDLDNEVCDAIDILALVLRLMRTEGLKPAIKNPQLQGWVIDFFRVAEMVSRTMGGAAGNEAFILRLLGHDVIMHMPFHHKDQASIAPAGAKRLVFRADEVAFDDIGQGDPSDPCRWSFILQLTPEVKDGHIVGPTFKVNGSVVRPYGADRCILRIPNPRTEHAGTWETLRVIWPGPSDQNWPATTPAGKHEIKWDVGENYWYVELDRENLQELLPNDWPYLPVFACAPSLSDDKKRLDIRLAEETRMRDVAATVRTALFGGIQALGKTFLSEPLTVLLRAAIVAQLNALSSEGVALHLELSGVDSEQTLDELSRILHLSGLRNLSLNREELTRITSTLGSKYFTSDRPSAPEHPFSVYLRAEGLLNSLDVDTLYVHDLQLDILLVRRKSIDPSDPSSHLERHRDAMFLANAAVPLALFLRAKEPLSWRLVLSTESLVALSRFATRYAELLTAVDDGANANDVVSSVLQHGFYDDGHREVIAIAAPSVYVDLPSTVSLNGAGDMKYAVRATNC